ncbi:hypothetical protein AYI68_g6560 [Smittium mucronatum]|uniref:Uncharacterized protein n=1 Tax=Smittium mucronatum TaxID=133383 RepID=A0A1R0GR49_9FUNG|nr:hypothetical protein AYI68_g6560 [Smittium mucronatum]
MAGITPLLVLSTLRLLLPVLTTLSVCTAPSVGITGENLTGGLGSEFNESSNKEDTSYSIIGSPARFTDGSKSSLSSRAEIKIEASLSLSSALLSKRQPPGQTHKSNHQNRPNHDRVLSCP